MLLIWLFLPSFLSMLPGTKRDRLVASVAVGLMAVVSLPIALHFMFAPGGRAVPDHLLGVTSVSSYLQQRGLVGPTFRWVSQNTDPDARIWVWCDDRVLYLDRWARSDSPYGPPGFLRLVESGGVSSIDDAIRADNVDFVLLRSDRCPESWDHATMEKHRWEIDTTDQTELQAWALTRLQELVRDDRHVLYRVNR
jgi:hypothetical protein